MTAILIFIFKVSLCLLLLGSWELGLDKISTRMQQLFTTDYNFQGLLGACEPWG